VSQSTDLLIAFDRFVSVFKPYNTTRSRVYYQKCICGSVVFGLTCCFLSIFDKFDENVRLLYCSTRVGLGFWANYLLWALAFLTSLATVILYVVILCIACFRKKKSTRRANMAKNPNNAALERTKRLMMKITQVSIVSSLSYFIVGPSNVIFAVLLKIYFAPKLAILIGQYVSFLFFSGSLIYFVSLFIFVAEFRSSVCRLLRWESS